MISILFVCHGNICRSPMAEYVMKNMIEREGLAEQFFIASAATSSEELGNPVHHGTRNKLEQLGISAAGKTAVKMKQDDYVRYDYLIGMDHYNIQNMKNITGGDPEHKIHALLDYTDQPGSIADPWYTGDFDATCRDVQRGCEALLLRIREKEGF